MGNRRGHRHWALRASDADREQVIDQLSEHCAAGRLSVEDLVFLKTEMQKRVR